MMQAMPLSAKRPPVARSVADSAGAASDWLIALGLVLVVVCVVSTPTLTLGMVVSMAAGMAAFHPVGTVPPLLGALGLLLLLSARARTTGRRQIYRKG